LLIAAVNWAAVTAIATSILAIGLLGGFAAAVFAAQQARETRRSREAQMAAEFFRRWNDDALVETRRMVARFKSADELRDAFAAYVAADAPEAYVLYRELDYFEQLAALERWSAFDLELIKLLLGRTLVERWEMWRPAIRQAHGPGAYPLFGGARREVAPRVGRSGRRRGLLGASTRPLPGDPIPLGHLAEPRRTPHNAPTLAGTLARGG